jgi:hypothetical protein
MYDEIMKLHGCEFYERVDEFLKSLHTSVSLSHFIGQQSKTDSLERPISISRFFQPSGDVCKQNQIFEVIDSIINESLSISDA